MSEPQSSNSPETSDAVSSPEANEASSPETGSSETSSPETSSMTAGAPEASAAAPVSESSDAASSPDASSPETSSPEANSTESNDAEAPAPSPSPESSEASSAAPSPAPASPPPSSRSRRKGFKNIPHGIAHIKSSFNNTIISISDLDGNVISWSSAGNVGFSGSRKSTPYAAQMAAETAGRKAMEHGMRRVDVHVSGPGSGRETALRSLQAIGLEVAGIKDVTPVPYNGCRQPKRRRV